MRLYQSVGPNPRVVTMFIAEKGITVPRVFVDLVSGENRREPYLTKNPQGGIPILELDDGSAISESTAICEYLEEIHPNPSLIGTTPEARARTRAAVREIDQLIVVPASNGFRSSEGLPLFKDRTLCVPEAAAGNKAYAADGFRRIDAMLAGRAFVTTVGFTLADIVLFCFVEFAGTVGQGVAPALKNIARWRETIAARPASIASANPKIGIEDPA